MSLLPLILEDLYVPSRGSKNYSSLLNYINDVHTTNPFYMSDIVRELDNLTIKNNSLRDEQAFRAIIDVQQFKSEEISVKLTGRNTVTIEGKHEEKLDEHGYVSRHFVRRYELPEDCDGQNIESKLSSDGVLTITAPKRAQERQEVTYVNIPVVRSDQCTQRGDGDDKGSN